MIWHSSSVVWDRIADTIQNFVARWHTPGMADRAFRFMLTAARAEFAEQVWPLIENTNTEIHLRAMRSVTRFHASILGADRGARLAALPEETRSHVLSELAMQGDFETLGLVTDIARADPSADVQLAVVESLSFRRADRHVNLILRDASPALWENVAATGYPETLSKPALAERLRAEREASRFFCGSSSTHRRASARANCADRR
jgi:hypothetical protein